MPEYQILEIKNGSQLDCLIDKKASYEQLEFGFSPEYLSTLKEQLQFPHALQFFAKMDNETVGYIAASELELFQGYMYVSELFVEPKVSGKGIASALVNKVVDFAKSEGLKGVYTQTENENIPAQKLYEKLAFSRLENPEWEGVTYKIEF